MRKKEDRNNLFESEKNWGCEFGLSRQIHFPVSVFVVAIFSFRIVVYDHKSVSG